MRPLHQSTTLHRLHKLVPKPHSFHAGLVRSSSHPAKQPAVRSAAFNHPDLDKQNRPNNRYPTHPQYPSRPPHLITAISCKPRVHRRDDRAVRAREGSIAQCQRSSSDGRWIALATCWVFWVGSVTVPLNVGSRIAWAGTDSHRSSRQLAPDQPFCDWIRGAPDSGLS